jgi:hypothetical protein
MNADRLHCGELGNRPDPSFPAPLAYSGKMTGKPLQAVGALLLTVVLTGCTAASETTAVPEPAIGPISVITTPEQVVFPVDAFLPSIDQELAVALHGQFLVNECAAAHGSSNRYVLGDQDDIAGFRSYLADSRRYSVTRNTPWGVFDPDLMRQRGYAPGDGSGIVGRAANVDDMAILEACIQAVETISPNGRVGMAFYVSDLPDGGSQWHPEDSRWLSAVGQWSACMSERGYNYASPTDAVGANAIASQDPDASAAERTAALAVAVADLDCKLQTNLVGQGVAIQSAYDQIYVDSHRDALAAQQAQIAAFLVAGIDALPNLDSLVAPTPAPS